MMAAAFAKYRIVSMCNPRRLAALVALLSLLGACSNGASGTAPVGAAGGSGGSDADGAGGSGATNGGGSDGNGEADATGGSGGSAPSDGGGGGLGGSAGASGPAAIAESCGAPKTVELLPGSNDWKYAILYWDAEGGTCSLLSGDTMSGAGSAVLLFVHEDDGSYSIWTRSPWSYDFGSGLTSSNNLPLNMEMSVLATWESLTLEIAFSFAPDSVTLHAVDVQ